MNYYLNAISSPWDRNFENQEIRNVYILILERTKRTNNAIQSSMIAIELLCGLHLCCPKPQPRQAMDSMLSSYNIENNGAKQKPTNK